MRRSEVGPDALGGIMRRVFVGVLCAVGAIISLSMPAGAAGPPVERFDGIYASCTGLGDVFVVTLPGRGPITPGFVLDGGQVLVPYEIHVVQTITPSDGSEPQVFTHDAVRRAPARGTFSTCTAAGSFETPDGTFSQTLEAKVVVHP
jgi:hypothetical protein